MAPITVDPTTERLALNPLSAPKPAAAPLPAPPRSLPANPILTLRNDWLRGDNSPDVDVDVHMHPLTLRFDDRSMLRDLLLEFRGPSRNRRVTDQYLT